MKPSMSPEPILDALVFVSSIVVYDEMKLQFRRCLGIDSFQKANELLMAVTVHAISDDLAIQHAECCKQTRCTVSLVIVCLSGRDSGPERQHRLCPVERLNLAFFVYAQYQRLLGRIQIESHNIFQLLDKMLVPAGNDDLKVSNSGRSFYSPLYLIPLFLFPRKRLEI